MNTKTRSKKAEKLVKSEAAAPRRKRQSGVRGRIVEMLAAGPQLAQDILDQGGFSPASLYLNLKALKAEGVVDTSREGRSVRYTLKGTSRTGTPTAAGVGSKRGRKAGSGTTDKPVADDLQSALGVLMARLAPIAQVDEKLMVLGQLAASLPGPVAGVLNAVIDDLGRLSGKR